MAEVAPVKEARAGSLLGWMLGLLAVGILVLGLGTYAVWRIVAPEVEVIRTATGVEVKTPVGDLRAKREGDETGLPKYPGAETTEPGATVEIESPTEESVAVTVAKYRSNDPLDKVEEWYKARLGPDFEREGSGRMERKRIIYGTDVSMDDVAFFKERELLLEAVILRKKGLATEIVLVRAGEPEAR